MISERFPWILQLHEPQYRSVRLHPLSFFFETLFHLRQGDKAG